MTEDRPQLSGFNEVDRTLFPLFYQMAADLAARAGRRESCGREREVNECKLISPTGATIFRNVLSNVWRRFERRRGNVHLFARRHAIVAVHMAVHPYSCFVSWTAGPRNRKSFTSPQAATALAELWFCPGCGVVMRKETPGAVRCPERRPNIGSFLHGLLELHPHRPIDGLGR